VVAPQIGEQSVYLAPRVAAVEVRELDAAFGVGMPVLEEGARVADRRGHREELHHDVHAAEQESLLPLHPRLIDRDAVEALASELATVALDEADVRCQPPEVTIAKRRAQPLEPQSRIPPGVEARDPGKRAEPRAQALPRIGHGARDLKVL